MNTRPVLLIAAVCLAATSLPAQTGLYFSEDNNPKGLYLLDTGTGAATNLGVNGVTSSTVGLAPTVSPFDLYGSSWTDLNRIKTDGSAFGAIGSARCEAMAYHRSTDTLYAFLNGSFFTLDTSVGGIVTNLNNPSGNDFEGTAYDIRRGVVWALPGARDRDTILYYYTPDTGLWTRYMDTGVDWSECGLAYDPMTDLLYAKDTSTSALIAIDIQNRNIYKVGDTTLNTGGGLAYVPEAVSLESTQYHLNAGDQLFLTTYDGLPAAPCALSIIDVSGVPVFRIIALGAFDRFGQFAGFGTVPAGLSGLDATLMSFGWGFVGGSKVIKASNPVTLNFL